jgi:5-methyltetrahydropteroyltriglutamate--homocysteine methyltransferase
VHDYQVARAAAGSLPVKAHVTGPVFLAENCRTVGSPYQGSTDPNLIKDIARAVAAEARFLREAGPEIVQIDEPTLAYGPLTYEPKVAFEALEEIRKEISGLSILHVCGDVTDIFDTLLDAPVDVLNVEWEYLRKLDIDAKKLADKNKYIALGCMAVDTDEVEELPRLEHTLRTARKRLKDRLWGVTPNCGLSQSDPEVALKKMKRLAEAVKALENEAQHVIQA